MTTFSAKVGLIGCNVVNIKYSILKTSERVGRLSRSVVLFVAVFKFLSPPPLIAFGYSRIHHNRTQILKFWCNCWSLLSCTFTLPWYTFCFTFQEHYPMLVYHSTMVHFLFHRIELKNLIYRSMSSLLNCYSTVCWTLKTVPYSLSTVQLDLSQN